MIGSIKNFFSGILSFLTGLVGGKKFQQDHPSDKAGGKLKASTAKPRKSKGYFMELDETDDQKLGEVLQQAKAVASKTLEQAKAGVSNASEQAKAGVSNASEQAKAGVSKASEQAKAAVSTPEPAAQPKAKPAKVAAAQPKADSAKTPAKVADAQPKADPATAPKVELVQTAEGLKAKPAKPASSVVSANGQNQAETTFAPKYLAPSASSNGRRRPGPNMNPFLDMARQVKTPG